MHTYMHIKWHVLFHSNVCNNILHSTSCTYFDFCKASCTKQRLLIKMLTKVEVNHAFITLDTLKAPSDSILLWSTRWKPQLNKQRALESGWLPESFASTTRPPVLRHCKVPNPCKKPSRQRLAAAMSNIVTFLVPFLDKSTTRVTRYCVKGGFVHL